jgi:hypothetical protein
MPRKKLTRQEAALVAITTQCQTISAKTRSQWIALADLRDSLARDIASCHYNRTEIDTALITLAHARRVAVAEQARRRSLTDRDHRAALKVGGRDKHLIALTG